jgi:ubiquinone/menaquinone biosynthesis C-methylase UbiE
MSWFDLSRIPEPEVMDDASEVQAYSSAAAETYLSKIDDSFVEHTLRLISSIPGRAIDIGCGPGQILMKLSARLPEWQFCGADRSLTMMRRATGPNSHTQPSDGGASHTGGRNLYFLAADAGSLPFRDHSFDLVLCNSVLHHIGDPARLLVEIRRIAKPDAAILLRDLRRPSRIRFPLHVRWHGRHYEGLMYKLYRDSVRAAYTAEELSAMLYKADICGARLFRCGATHLGIERCAGAGT